MNDEVGAIVQMLRDRAYHESGMAWRNHWAFKEHSYAADLLHQMADRIAEQQKVLRG